MTLSLPKVLAGPILRRCSQTEVCVWLATSRKCDLAGRVFDAATARVLGLGKPEGVRTVEVTPGSFYVTLIRIKPTADKTFPVDSLLGYAVRIDGIEITDLVKDITVGGFQHPTFYLTSESYLSLAHASCRKLHGPGIDGMKLLADRLDQTTLNLRDRPALLCLTGDQIYADDVADELVDPLHQIADALGLDAEWFPDGSNVKVWKRGKNQKTIKAPSRGAPGGDDRSAPALTSTEMKNQVVGFGQYVGLYLLAWNPVVAEKLRSSSRFSSELEEGFAGSAAARRVLANVPTYMIMDDHEITDDWNIDNLWLDRVDRNKMTRRLIANGLCAFWLFQGWGNEPDRFGADEQAITDYLAKHTASSEQAVLGINWTFGTPEGVVFVDTRTHRARGDRVITVIGAASDRVPPARLLGQEGIRRVVEVLTAAKRKPAIVVLPAPAFGPSVVETIQAITMIAGKYWKDVENWTSTGSLGDLEAVLVEAGVSHAVALSGDVHHAYVTLQDTPNRKARIVQFTSSSLKNAPGKLMKALLHDVIAGNKVVKEITSGAVWKRFAALVRKEPAMLAVLRMSFEPWLIRTRMAIEGPDTEPDRAWVSGSNNIGLLRVDGRITMTIVTTDENREQPTFTFDQHLNRGPRKLAAPPAR